MSVLQQKRIVLGVTGGIAAYKVVQLARDLTLAGALVDVIMTEEARQFVGPLTFQALTRRPVHTELFSLLAETEISHVTLGVEADIVVIAPATAHTIARIAAGLSDDLLTTTVLATRAPVLIVPAMNVNMWANQATVENIATLRRRGMVIIEPDVGRMAENMSGPGRLPEVTAIEDAIRAILGQRHGALRGRHVVVTAGGTHEPLDPVRFIGNRSSGRMGFALAAAARDLGAEVTLIAGPTALPTPGAVSLMQVETAQEMSEAVLRACERCDLLLMAAAVADYRPVEVATEKIKKTLAGGEELVVRLVRNPDILGQLADREDFIKVGFAAETSDLLNYAYDKLRRKKLHLIVANEARSSIGSAESAVIIVGPDGAPRELPRLPKEQIAEAILVEVIRRWPERLGSIDNSS